MHDAVAPDHDCVFVGEKREGVARFAAEIARLFRRIDADRDRLDPGGAQLGEVFFETP
jgi:hypothetical protein